MIHLAAWITVVVASLLPTAGMAGEGFGIILEIRGAPAIQRGGSTIAARFGDELVPGDSMETGSDDQLIFVAYATCDEWTLPAMSEARIIDAKTISSGKGGLTRSARLPVCYTPEAFSVGGPNVIGGTLLYSPPPKSAKGKDTGMGKLQHAADTGQASNSELMSLIVLSLRQGRTQQARAYSSQLLARNPGAELPAPLLQRMEASQP
jgi:hypothetical protein